MVVEYVTWIGELFVFGDDYICLLFDIFLQGRRGGFKSKKDTDWRSCCVGNYVIVMVYSKLLL